MKKSNKTSIQAAFIRAKISEDQAKIIMAAVEDAIDDECWEAQDEGAAQESYAQAMSYMYE